MMQEELPAIGRAAPDLPFGKRHLVVGEGFVQGRAGDLDHFQAGRAFQHAMADAGRLQDHVARRHDERLALILVDDPDPALADADQLEGDAVIMDPVGDRPALGDRDVRGDVAAAEPARDQVAIMHARAALSRGVPGMGHHEFGLEIGQVRRTAAARPGASVRRMLMPSWVRIALCGSSAG